MSWRSGGFSHICYNNSVTPRYTVSLKIQKIPGKDTCCCLYLEASWTFLSDLDSFIWLLFLRPPPSMGQGAEFGLYRRMCYYRWRFYLFFPFPSLDSPAIPDRYLPPLLFLLFPAGMTGNRCGFCWCDKFIKIVPCFPPPSLTLFCPLTKAVSFLFCFSVFRLPYRNLAREVRVTRETG